MSEAWRDWCGRSETISDIVTPSLITRFNAVIGSNGNDEIPPLGLHWCLGTPTTAMDGLGLDGHPAKGGFLPPIPLPRRMWASSDIEFLNPLEPEGVFRRVSRVDSITPKTGSTGELVFVRVHHEVSIGDTVCIQEAQTIVYREASNGIADLPASSGFQAGDFEFVETLRPTPQLLFRFSALTFNTHRIHYDGEYAAEEGYPALVVHGPLMACLLLRFASEKLGASTIKTFSFRGYAPAYCGQDLYLTLARAEAQSAMEVRGADGRLVMSATVN
ncbi:MAG: MaoC family dehydratase N-terminal domain-containing protein [Henriciella sp.]